MNFREFLINEERMVTVDADDANAAQQVKKAGAMDADRLANKQAVDAQAKKQAVKTTTDPSDPAARLKTQRASLAAQIAQLDKRIAQMSKGA